MNRRLHRCRHDKRIAGVASGVAEYFDLDPSLVRVLWLVSIFFGALTLVLYIGMWIIVPLEPLAESEITARASGSAPGHRHATSGESRWSLWFGLVLVLIGAIALIDVVVPDWTAARYFWPLFLVGAGAILVTAAIRRTPAAPAGPPTPPPPSTEPTGSAGSTGSSLA